jgi:hypothetical protein
VTGGSSAQAGQFVNQLGIAIADWSTAMAATSVQWLLGTLGQSTEPDLSGILPVYDRMLAIALLLVGAILALSLIERIASGSPGVGLGVIPRVLAAAFVAYTGLAGVKYLAGYAALIATTWSADFNQVTDTLVHSVALSDAATQAASSSGPHVSTFGLIVTAFCLCSLAVMVHLELVVRSALILTVTSFVPLVAVLSIWPRLAGAATTLAEFLIGLLLSKFVVATAVYVGFRLVVIALVSPTGSDATENWMASGVAVLLIAAFSPLVIFSALRFTHNQAGSAARGLAGAAVSLVPAGKVVGTTTSLLRPLARSAQKRLGSKLKRLSSRE